MGRKKFIDKKKSATFQLLARDSSDPNYDEGPSGDRVFVRVDNNPYFIHGFGDENDDGVSAIDHNGYPREGNFSHDPESIFADAPGDEDEDEDEAPRREIRTPVTTSAPLPDHLRREILELGLPDDGYNYLLHLREIKNTGGGSAFYQNSKAKLDQLPLDVKAYDASKVRVARLDGNSTENSIYSVASKTVGVRIQKAVDPEVAALLDDSDLSRFGSDVEDLEEDFVVQANLPEQREEVDIDSKTNLAEQPEIIKMKHIVADKYCPQDGEFDFNGGDEPRSHQPEGGSERVTEKPRVRRILDEQFDVLALQEYGTDDDSNYDGSIAAEDEFLADKLNHALQDHSVDDLGLVDKYKVPADFLHGKEGPNNEQLMDSAADVIRRCAEYAEMYNDETQNEEVVILEESSDESEGWDCETIVSTYSNLDNHPGKIEAPGNTRKKKMSETVSAVLSASNHVISLRGKEKLPVDFLPHNRKAVVEKVIKEAGLKSDRKKRQAHGEESKEEKKERKAAVKEERREARRAKKEMKGLYRGEAQRAQKVAAISGPSSVHLM